MAEQGSDAQSPANEPPADTAAGTALKVRPRQKRKTKPERKELPPFNVVLLNDNDHTFDYVIEMLGKVCQHSVERATAMAKEVDESGRAIVLTTHKERAELKRDQILSYGPDVRIAACTRSMDAVIEPAEG
jgi:ATP-dependent Clp protease adaptor protein ClpS